MAPMPQRVAPDRLYIVNALGFEVFLSLEIGERISLERALERAMARRTIPVGWDLGGLSISKDERTDLVELAQRTRWGIPPYVRGTYITLDDTFYPKTHNKYPISIPEFKGVGILSACSGDGRYGPTLLEIKSGDRKIRSIDLRQVIIYYLLSTIDNSDNFIDRCLLLNPRQGYRVSFNFPDLMNAISGLTLTEFTSTLRDYLVNWKECE